MTDRFAFVDNEVIRCQRPTEDQATYVVSHLGVKSALNLEYEQSDVGLWPAGVVLERIADFEPLPALSLLWQIFSATPSLADIHIIHGLRALRRMPGRKVVHCRSGQNRTGVMVAAYRILEKNEQLALVLADFMSFQGLWAPVDSFYIKTIAARLDYFKGRIE